MLRCSKSPKIPVLPNMFMHHTVNDSHSMEAAAKLKTKWRPLLPRAPPFFLIQHAVWCHAAPRLSQRRYYLTDMKVPHWARLGRMLNGRAQLEQKQYPTFTFSLGNDVKPFEVGFTAMSWFWSILHDEMVCVFSVWNNVLKLGFYAQILNPSGLTHRSSCLTFKKIILIFYCQTCHNRMGCRCFG